MSRRYLSHIGVWPNPRSLDVDGWLGNFSGERDLAVAAALLGNYVHLNEEQIVHAVAATIRSLSAEPRFGLPNARRESWGHYLDHVRISFPLSRSGDETGSGYIFARIASGQLDFREDQIYEPDRLVKSLAGKNESADLILLDDISASGTQFIRSWKRQIRTDHGKVSLADLSESGKISSAYFLPVVATEDAKIRIEQDLPVVVNPAYVLTAEYSGLSQSTRLVPSEIQEELKDFLQRHSVRTGKDEYGVAGYGDLGLAVSFHHGCPNNTLPVLQWGAARENWKPLVS